MNPGDDSMHTEALIFQIHFQYIISSEFELFLLLFLQLGLVDYIYLEWSFPSELIGTY